MRTLIAALCLMLASSLTLACECSFRPLDDDAIHKAKHIFAFRLLSAAIDQPGAAKEEVLYSAVGTIEVVETLRGSGSKFQRVRFTTFSCCGTRLDVGHVYFAFTNSDGPEFEGHVGSLLVADTDSVKSVVTGRTKLRDIVSETTVNRISEIPPPPVPCPTKAEG